MCACVRQVALDTRGYGWSDKPTALEDYSIDKLVTDVRDAIHTLGYDTAVRPNCLELDSSISIPRSEPTYMSRTR